MIVTKPTTQVQSTMQGVGNTHVAGIDNSAFAHIIGVLTDLYKDRVAAFVREYATNAFDANVEAGVKRPIEVTLPNAFEPNYVVRDFGAGLTEPDIATIYSRYGTSTKRDSNDVVGMLGLGCKSALTYTSQFTVTSVTVDPSDPAKRRKLQVLITRKPDGTPVMQTFPYTATDEPTGTAVAIPVERGDVQRVEQKARFFFSFWDKGMVLINGKEPARLLDQEGVLRLSDTLAVVPSGLSYDYVVMGNVAYPHTIPTNLPHGYKVVARVPIGAVNFPPSREALMDTETTKATLRVILDDLRKGLVAAVEREVSQAQTPMAAIRAKLAWGLLLPQGAKVHYAGKAIPKMFPGVYMTTGLNSNPMNRVRSADYGLDIDTSADALFAVGFDIQKMTANHKRKMQKFVADKGMDGVRTVVLSANTVLDPLVYEWVPKDRIVRWSDINAVKLPSAAKLGGPSGRITGSYDAYIDGDSKVGIPAANFDQTKPIWYYHGNLYEARRYNEFMAKRYPNGFTLACMGGNRLEKFQRDFPAAQNARKATQSLWDQWIGTLTADEKLALSIKRSGNTRELKQVIAVSKEHGIALADPALSDAARALSTVDTQALLAKTQEWQYVSEGKMPADFSNPLDSYPLVDYYSTQSHPKHTLVYINAAFAAKL